MTLFSYSTLVDVSKCTRFLLPDVVVVVEVYDDSCSGFLSTVTVEETELESSSGSTITRERGRRGIIMVVWFRLLMLLV